MDCSDFLVKRYPRFGHSMEQMDEALLVAGDLGRQLLEKGSSLRLERVVSG